MASETLGQGFVQKLKPGCNKILEEVGSVSLCNLSNKCTTGAYNARPGVNDVELCNGSVRESMSSRDGIVGNNEFNKGCPSNDHLDDKLSILGNGDGINNNDVSLSDELICFENFMGEEPSSTMDADVYTNGINLFVEVFGPLDGVSDSNTNLNGAGQECSIFKNEREKNIGEQEWSFDVGDLVWVKTRTPLWWPGMIYDPSNAANDETKSETKGSVLVKYFGNANFIWCNNPDLKPFIEYYEQLSVQNTSRSFSGSVEKALCEIGRRVKSKMTCPCFSKENKTEENSMPVVKKCKIDVLSSSHFEPPSFLACIKQFAGSVNMPSKIELVLTKNRLSSFYRSIGHRELSLQLLHTRDTSISEVKDEGCNNNNNNNISVVREKSARAKKKRQPSDYDDLDKIALSGKGSESRERKKSKYLSYPFTDVNHGPNNDSDKEQETDLKHQSKKKGLKKSLKLRHIISKADDINASSSELVIELFSTARDHFYIGRSKYSDSLKKFYSNFRSYAFLDADIADKEAMAQQAPKRRPKNSSIETDWPKESENLIANLASVKESVDNAGGTKKSSSKKSKKGKLRAKGSAVCTIAEKKEERAMLACLELEKNSVGVGASIYHNKFWIRDEENRGPPHGDSISRLPDLNNNNPISVERIPVVGHFKIPFVPEQKKEGLFVSPSMNGVDELDFASFSPSNDVPLAPQTILNFNISTINGEFGAREVGSTTVINTGLGSFAHQPPPLGFSPQTEPKIRKRKETSFQPAASSVIPDLNGNALDMMASSSEKNALPDENIQSAENKSQEKKGKKRSADDADPGGAILLKFAPGSALPPNELLFAKFSRYGLVKESEIHTLDDSTVRIPYERTADVKFAFRSLERSCPFGESVIGFNLLCAPEPSSKKSEQKNKLIVRNVSYATTGPLKSPAPAPAPFLARAWASAPAPAPTPAPAPARPAETRDIAFMKREMERMKVELEKRDDIAPEVRATLEHEINAFLNKIRSMPGGSSSSSSS